MESILFGLLKLSVWNIGSANISPRDSSGAERDQLHSKNDGFCWRRCLDFCDKATQAPGLKAHGTENCQRIPEQTLGL
jgi:hypothetical protein